MQIEAIRAHPGSAHVMVYGTRRNPSCCMTGITTAAPRACPSPATAPDTGGLQREPRAGTGPPSPQRWDRVTITTEPPSPQRWDKSPSPQSQDRAPITPEMGQNPHHLRDGTNPHHPRAPMTPEPGQIPITIPSLPKFSEEHFPKALLLFHGYTSPAISKPHQLLGCERRRDGGGEHHPKVFFPTKSAPSRALLHFDTWLPVDVLC